MKNKTPQKNPGFRNSFYLGIFIIILLAASISMIAINVYRYVAPYGSNSEIITETSHRIDTVYISSPPKEIRIHDTVWRTRPVSKVSVEVAKKDTL
jgi:hypothetical protein